MLLKNVPVLKRLATTASPFQGMAASLAVEPYIILIRLASINRQFADRKIYCIDAVQMGALSEDRNLHAVAQFWQGDTFTYCYNQPQMAIDHLNGALSNVDGNAVLRSAIYGDLSIAHAQHKDECNAKENEKKALEYAMMARQAMPDHPELDSSYRCINVEHSVLDQFEGRAFLYLAEHFPNNSYARQAYDAFHKATTSQFISKGFLSQALSRKADTARALGDMDECIKCLTNGFLIAVEIDDLDRLTQVDTVLQRIPQKWQKETAIERLQKDTSHSIVVARR